MTVFDRPLLLEDRPTLVDPIVGGDDDEEEPEREPKKSVEVIGSGGGKTVHGVEFEEGHEEVIKGSNLVAMLATGEDGGSELYENIFKTSAIQLKRAKDMGKDISGVSLTSEELNAHTIGVKYGWEKDDEPDVDVEDSAEDGTGEGDVEVSEPEEQEEE